MIKTPPIRQLEILPEPVLQFRYGQCMALPQDGLSVFGPVDSDAPSAPASIPYLAIGSERGLRMLGQFIGELQSVITVDDTKHDLRLWPPFPGFGAAFNSRLDVNPAWSVSLDEKSLLDKCKEIDPNKRAFSVVDKYMQAMLAGKKKDETFSLAICVIPDEVWRSCRPESHIVDPHGEGVSRRGRIAREYGQIDAFTSYDPRSYQLSVDFRRQLKARSSELELPVQIIRESTLRINDKNDYSERQLTPLSDRAWNLSSALYYKAGGKPWKVMSPREGVCYIGIAFKQTSALKDPASACCAAQLFVDSGDGVVFLGESGRWYSPKNKQFHLSRDAARNLLSGVLDTYKQLGGRKLNEIFLHARSHISDDEFRGYLEACPKNVSLSGIRVRPETNGIKLYRLGSRPVLRGGFLKVGDRTGYLWASGFKDRLGTYDGQDTPNPVRIDIEHGNSDIKQVAQDIFGLTKLNYNACRLGERLPVTVGFSDAVGEILIANPGIDICRPNFKYYI